MGRFWLSRVPHIAGILILLSVGIASGLFLRELTWPALRNYPLLRFAVTGLLIAAPLMLSVLCAYEREKVVQAARGTGMMVFVLAIALSVVYVSSFFSEDVKRGIIRGLALVFFSALPAGLYLQFMWSERTTIWTEYVRNIFRLHVDEYACLPEPPTHSCFHALWLEARPPGQDRDNLYREKFEAVFGPFAGHAQALAGVLDFRTFLPVAVATILISAGWLFVMLTPASGPSVSQTTQEISSSDLATVREDSFQFAFLGAYFFIVQSLVRRYFQRDLKPDAYINATARIIIVALLVWVVVYAASTTTSRNDPNSDGKLGLMNRGAMAYLPVLAFVIGVFPVIGWRFIQSIIKAVFRKVVHTLDERFPLCELEGLNVWYESRLMEEGIENMENLATANLIDVMLNTRVPINRLVDWVDQSLLYLHLGETDKTVRDKLRRLGVRTATDIVDLMRSDQHIDGLARVLNEKDDDGPDILECIHATLRDEPNFFHVQEWKKFPRAMLSESTNQGGRTVEYIAQLMRVPAGASKQPETAAEGAQTSAGTQLSTDSAPADGPQQ